MSAWGIGVMWGIKTPWDIHLYKDWNPSAGKGLMDRWRSRQSPKPGGFVELSETWSSFAAWALEQGVTLPEPRLYFATAEYG